MCCLSRCSNVVWLGVTSPPDNNSSSRIAPVEMKDLPDDTVSASLAILSKLYHYNLWIFDMVRDHLGPTVAEVGAGIGNITQFLLNSERVTCLEPFKPYCDYLTRRFADHLNVEISPSRIEDCPNTEVRVGEFDSVICLNVLEHIADDVDALRRMKQLLRPGGRVIVLVPALGVLFGPMDRAMGHHRRYTMGSLKRAFHNAGLKPIWGRYMNLAGAIGWWWTGKVLKKSQISASKAEMFNRIVPILSAFERLIPIPVGQSVVVVGGL